jgi:hypothetical protein
LEYFLNNRNDVVDDDIHKEINEDDDEEKVD